MLKNVKTKNITMKEEDSSAKNNRRKQITKHICLGLFAVSFSLLAIAYKLTIAPPSRDKMVGCIFCDIVAGKSPTTKIEVDTDEYVIFEDINPDSTYHFLCVSKQHIESLKTMTKDDIPLVNHMEAALKDFYQSKGIDTEDALFGFHMPPSISVNHLHMHAIAPRSTMSWKNSFVFLPSSPWFKLPQDARDYLQKKS